MSLVGEGFAHMKASASFSGHLSVLEEGFRLPKEGLQIGLLHGLHGLFSLCSYFLKKKIGLGCSGSQFPDKHYSLIPD